MIEYCVKSNISWFNVSFNKPQDFKVSGAEHYLLELTLWYDKCIQPEFTNWVRYYSHSRQRYFTIFKCSVFYLKDRGWFESKKLGLLINYYLLIALCFPKVNLKPGLIETQ